MPNNTTTLISIGPCLLAFARTMAPGPRIERGGFIAEMAFWGGRGRLWSVTAWRVPYTRAAIYWGCDCRKIDSTNQQKSEMK